MTGKWYEIYLGKKHITPEVWEQLFARLKLFLGWRAHWHIIVLLQDGVFHYYLNVSMIIPASIGVSELLCKLLPEAPDLPTSSSAKNWNFLLNYKFHNLPQLIHKMQRKDYEFRALQCEFHYYGQACIATSDLILSKNDINYIKRLPLTPPSSLLSIDFVAHQNYRYKKIPSYLNSEKVQRLAVSDSKQPLLLLDNFPYAHDCNFLELSSFDFAKHSLVIGSSGSGKSRFLCLLIDRIYHTAPDKYKVVVIDPHDALKYDLGEITDQKIVDFQTAERSVDLFGQELENINVSVELMLGTFRSLIGESYNGRLERVLRHSIYLLLLDHNFSFSSLRQLLSDTEYRNETVARLKVIAPTSISRFFLTEFQELKSQSYDTAFAPIVSFIDEMQMVPVFNFTSTESLSSTICDIFLSVFSLNRLRLGDKSTQVVAGLLMQQLFLIAQKRDFPEHLVVIVDEVAVIENPILSRFLSEMRKYNVSVILAGQYFGQISQKLRDSILANVVNHYIFRVSRSDAKLLAENLQIKIPRDHKEEDESKLFTGLKARECLAQISCRGEPYAIFKANTPDYDPRPNSAIPPEITTSSSNDKLSNKPKIQLLIDPAICVEEIMLANTTNRKKLNQEEHD